MFKISRNWHWFWLTIFEILGNSDLEMSNISKKPNLINKDGKIVKDYKQKCDLLAKFTNNAVKMLKIKIVDFNIYIYSMYIIIYIN